MPSGGRMPPLSPLARRCLLTALSLSITVAVAWYRHSPFFIWSDSGGAVSMRPSELAAQHQHERERFLSHPLLLIMEITSAAFAKVFGGGYRPLAGAYKDLAFILFYHPDGPRFLPLLGVGAVYGALALSV